MNNEELKIAIILIEGEYPRELRNTPSKMKELLKKEFNLTISESAIEQFYGISEDYEKYNRQVHYENRY